MKKLLLFILFVCWIPTVAQTYCVTNLYTTGCTAGDDLDGISLGTYSQVNTPCGTNGFSDFTATPIPVVRSNNYYIFTATTNYTFASEYVGVWIDWNNDGDFNDTTEFMLASSTPIGGAAATYTDSMLIDNSRPTGIFRMRVRLVWNTALTAPVSCNSFTWGETHDYAIEVKPNVVGNCNFFTNFKVDSITPFKAKVDWVPGSGSASFYLEYGPMGFFPGSPSGTKITGTYPGAQPPVYLTGLTPSTTYDYYFGEICNSGSDTAYFATVQSFTTAQSCPDPSGLTLVQVGDTLVVVSTTGSGTLFDYTWGPAGFNQGSPGTGFKTTGPNFTIDSLLYPGGTFHVYVRANCDSLGVSQFIGPITFTTNCIKQNLPYTENFNTNLGCMKPVDGGTSADTWEWQPAGGAATPGDLDGTGFAGVDSDEYGQSAYMREMLESPAIDASNLTGSLVVEFDQFFNSIGGDSAAVQVFDGTQWHTVLNMQTDFGSFANPDHQYINATQYANADFQVRFLYDDGNVWAWYWLVDNFSVREVLCDPSSNLVNNFAGPDSATFNWVPGSAGSFWVEYGPAGFIPGNGTQVMVTDSFFNLGGLFPQTLYELFIVDSCLTGFADTLGPITFTTSCPVQSLPYIENFNVDLGCMQAQNGGTSSATWEWQPAGGTATPGDLDGTGFAGVDSDKYGIAAYMHELLVSPPIDAGSLPTTSSLILEFDQYYNWIGSDSALVQVFDGLQWRTILSMHQSYGAFGQPDHRKYDVTQYANANFQVRFIYDDGNVWAWYWLVDNLKVEEALCGIASNPQVVNTTINTAVLNWTSNGGNWNINWGPAGFTQASGTGNFIKNVTSRPYTLTGLTGSTCYDYFVQDTCVGVGAGSWAGPFTFCTQCLPYTLPYKEGFASPTLPNCYTLANSSNDPTANWIYAGTWPGYGAAGKNNAPGSVGGAWGVDGSIPNDTNVQMFTPTFLLTGANLPYLKFKKFQNNVDIAQNMTLYVDIFDGANWINGVIVDAANSPNWVAHTLNLANYTVSGPIQFRFRVNELTGNPSPFYSDLLIDDIEVYDSSAVCAAPSNLRVNVVACDSIQLNWQGATDSALVVFALAGTLPTGGTIVANDSVAYITGTQSNSTYNIYVSNICGGDTSLPITALMINTGRAGAPVAGISYTANGLTINFDGSGSQGSGNSYSWDFGGGSTTTGVNPSFTFATGGSKTITLTVTNACGTDDTTFTIAGISLEEMIIGASVGVFPNPVEEQLQLNIEMETDDQVAVQILTISGQAIWERSYAKASVVKDDIDFRQLAAGVYIIRVETSKGAVNRRIVKQ